MSEKKEFQGKSLDDAIRQACDYYGVEREKLEIDIVSAAKSGIFGLVGARKATVRAARLQPAKSVMDMDGLGKPEPLLQKEPRAAKPRQAQPKKDKPEPQAEPSQAVQPPQAGADKKSARPKKNQTPKAVRAKAEKSLPAGKTALALEGAQSLATAGPKHLPALEPFDEMDDLSLDSFAAADEKRGEEPPVLRIDAENEPLVLETVKEVVARLVLPIVGEVACHTEHSEGRINVGIEAGDSSGLLVGREGQTLAAIHYLASRIASRRLNGSVRLHIDAGNYKERQEDKLKETALSLAAKLKATGKPQSTRALSAYQRRVIHMIMESDSEVVTRSKGDGAQRRVVFYLRKNSDKRGRGAGAGKNAESGHDQDQDQDAAEA